MRLYKVNARIDRKDAIYVPEGKLPHGSKLGSAGNGLLTLVDSTGFIELSDDDAAPLLQGRAISHLDEEIRRLEKERDEAIAKAEKAQEELDKRKAQLEKVVAAKKSTGAPSAEALAIDQATANEPELVASGGKEKKSKK